MRETGFFFFFNDPKKLRIYNESKSSEDGILKRCHESGPLLKKKGVCEKIEERGGTCDRRNSMCKYS